MLLAVAVELACSVRNTSKSLTLGTAFVSRVYKLHLSVITFGSLEVAIEVRMDSASNCLAFSRALMLREKVSMKAQSSL